MNDTRYDNAEPIVNKTLNPDGSITDIEGNEVDIENAHNKWRNRTPIPNKLLNPDGSITTLPLGYSKEEIDEMLEMMKYPRD